MTQMDTSSRQLHLQGEGRTGGRSSEVTEWHGPTRTPRVQVRYGVCVWKYIYIYMNFKLSCVQENP